MKNDKPTVFGTNAPPSRPTKMGAAVVAALIAFPIGITLFTVDLLLL